MGHLNVGLVGRLIPNDESSCSHPNPNPLTLTLATRAEVKEMDEGYSRKRTRDSRTNDDVRKRECRKTETHQAGATKRENREVAGKVNVEERDFNEIEGFLVELTEAHDAEMKSMLQCHQEELREMKEMCCREKEALCSELTEAYERDIAQREDMHSTEMEALSKMRCKVTEGLQKDMNTLRRDTVGLSSIIRNVINDVNIVSMELMQKLGSCNQLLNGVKSGNRTTFPSSNETATTHVSL